MCMCMYVCCNAYDNVIMQCVCMTFKETSFIKFKQVRLLL